MISLRSVITTVNVAVVFTGLPGSNMINITGPIAVASSSIHDSTADPATGNTYPALVTANLLVSLYVERVLT